MWTERLEENGLSVLVVDSRHVRIGRGDQSEIYRIVQPKRRQGPRDIAVLGSGENALLVAPALSSAASGVARNHGWSVITDSGPAWIQSARGTIELADESRDDESPNFVRQLGYGTFNVVRAMLESDSDRPLSQNELSRTAQRSQPRISQILGRLANQGLVTRCRDGWATVDRATAVEWWTNNYPGPGGLRAYWFGLDTAVEQARLAYDLLAAVDGRPLVSGDVAADTIAPWRAPRRALLYSARGADFTDSGLTSVGPNEATLTIVLPEDRGMWPATGHPPTAEVDGRPVVCASPLQVLYDLQQGLGPDSAEAADVWRQRILKVGDGPA